MKNINWATVEEAKEFEKVAVGGYICKITAIEDVEAKEYLKISYDIAIGDFKDYYKNLNESKGFWGATFFKSYKDTALSFFKGFLTALQSSNQGFLADTFNDPNILVGKYVGLVLSEEEYISKQDGTIKTRLYVSQVRSVDAIRTGDFAVADKKTVNPEQAGFICPSIDDINAIPF